MRRVGCGDDFIDGVFAELDTAIKIRPQEDGWPSVRLDWLALVIAALASFVGLPFLAPVFMWAGWEGLARGVYWVYGALCHQMAQRSFFLFGPRGFQMYSLDSLPLADEALAGNAALVMRQFIGNADIGWKVAWSDRMVFMYGATLLFAVAYGLWHRRGVVRPLPIWAFAALLLPMVIDGSTHMLSDTAGLTEGFRYTNAWLADLTNRALPAWFYAGDSLGSFNSWMRLLSGITFGFAVVGLLFPRLDIQNRPSGHRTTGSEPFQRGFLNSKKPTKTSEEFK